MLRSHRARLSLPFSLTALLLGAGCGPATEPETGTPTGTAAVAARSAAEAPQPGAVVVELREGGVHLWANDAPRRDVLYALSEALGFSLRLREFEPQRLTLRLDDATQDAAIAAVLRGVPYKVTYGHEPAAGHVARKLAVGSSEQTEELRARMAEAKPGRLSTAERTRLLARARLLRDRRERDEAEIRRIEREVEADMERYRADVAAQLEDPDPEVRASTIAQWDTESPEGLARAVALAVDDPDPRVRAAALQTLADDGRPQARAVVLEALGEADPTLVAAAVEAIGSMGDASLLPRVEPLAQHPDPEVRAAVENARLELQ